MNFNLSKLFSGADGIAHLIGAGYLSDTVKSAISPYLNQYFSDKASATDWKHAKNMYYMQLAQDQMNNNRSEALQREAWQRDDTSYQRTVSDMRAAGLNPLLIGGTNGSSSVSFSGGASGSVPSTNYSQLQGSDPFSTLASLVQYADSAKLARDQFYEQKTVNAGNDESRRKADQIAEKQQENANAKHEQEMLILKQELKKATSEADRAEYELDYDQSRNITSHTPEKVALAREAIEAAKEAKDAVKTASKKTKQEEAPKPRSFEDWLKQENPADYRYYMEAKEANDQIRLEKIFKRYNQKYMNEIKR